MPTYEYQCSKCGVVTEVFQAITEPTRRKLRKADEPQCSCQATVTRLIGTGAGVIFKGSGFYQTDYRSESYKKAAKADKEAANGNSSKDGKDKSGKAGDGKATQAKGEGGAQTKSPTKKEAHSSDK